MGTTEERHFFPLTSLQIGDLQSYLSRLTLFLVPKGKKFLILVDNRPWLDKLDARATHFWQFMVTKSRLSPFANTRGRKKKNGESVKVLDLSNEYKWYTLIDAAVRQKKILFPVEKLKDSFLLHDELHHILYGFIVFEVEWAHVRGMNYLNELQTDTSMAMEVRWMKRWEFDSIEQASNFVFFWYKSNASSDRKLLQEYLDSLCNTGDIFYDAEEELSTSSDVEMENTQIEGLKDISQSTSGAGKRREFTRMNSEIVSAPSNFEPAIYKDVFIVFRFSDHDLPFNMKNVIMADLRLLRLLEYGLPSWAMFLQSYPVFCKIYRPWMCPMARVLYVMISTVTVLIGFYDLYKNVPVLKATALHLFGPFSDWMENWEMVSRIQYLGTMLFLQNFEKAVRWFLVVTRGIRSVLSILTKPFAGPFLELMQFLSPLWNLCMDFGEDVLSVAFSILGSLLGICAFILDVLIWPFWFLATGIVYPMLWLTWEIVATPARVVFTISGLLGVFVVRLYYLIRESWSSLSVLLQFASATEVTIGGAYQEASMWKSLWNDIFSQVFRAIRSILNGFVAFFVICNRHRLSTYNHTQEFFMRLSHAARGNTNSDMAKRRRNCLNQKPIQECERSLLKQSYVYS
ncbi:hypothetical protein LUZ63_001302 [Rhynchospora breviuscula]|uniref:Uncharacterized protein n=1 Tax=Rhynchospora breviuscula TaxID=2022672 RepID=A0A9Q0CX29_9POAL|nr:hypothetical protein LUZ63_001302 [Rhynchospora breviuscula]